MTPRQTAYHARLIAQHIAAAHGVISPTEAQMGEAMKFARVAIGMGAAVFTPPDPAQAMPVRYDGIRPVDMPDLRLVSARKADGSAA